MVVRAGVNLLALIAAVARRRTVRAQRQRAADDARCAEVCRELGAGNGAFMHDHRLHDYRKAVQR